MTDPADLASLEGTLSDRGFTPAAAAELAGRFRTCAASLGGGRPLRVWWVPGRIEVLGKHTDYAGGRSLLCATDLGAAFAVRPRPDRRMTIHDLRSGQRAAFEIGPDLEPTVGDWTNYPQTAARRLARNFGPLRGADIAFAGTLPPAAGMSSSSALIVAFASILLDLNALPDTDRYRANIHSREDLAGYLGTVENGQTFGDLEGAAGVGTFGGSEDHTAIVCCRPAALEQFSFCPVRRERTIPFPESHAFVIASSGVVAEKTGAALERFNRASRLAKATVDAINGVLGTTHERLADAVDAHSADDLRSALSAAAATEFDVRELSDRFEQFLEESERIVPAAGDALDSGDTAAFSEVVARSQERGAKLLNNQVEQTVWLAEEAGRLGAAGASAFGAGFGGSVWALVERSSATVFAARWREAYVDRFSDQARTAEFLVTRPGPAAFGLRLD